MVIHRPHRGGLSEAMAEKREFDSIEECINTLIKEFNAKYSYIFHLIRDDICVLPYDDYDERIGWRNVKIICCVSYDSVHDKKGYESFFGGKYYNPQQIFGFVSSDYK